MTKFLVLFLTLSLALLAQAPTPTNFIWFDQVKGPMSISEEQLLNATQKLHDGLKRKLPTTQILQGIPDDPTSRIVFLTIGDDQWPGKTYFGTGFSFHDALKKALYLLQINEKVKREEIIKQANAIIKEAEQKHLPPPQDWIARKANPSQWNWLKMHVVQATRAYDHFYFNRSKFAFSDLVGFAFSSNLGFAFTPDQITGRYLLTNQNFVSKKQVGNIIAESFNFEALSTWLRSSTAQDAQRIFLFEVDTYYTDGLGALRLFRGHQLPSIPTADQCLEAATKASRAVAERLVPASGELRPPFPDWRQHATDNESLDDLAEFSLALRLLAKTTGNQALMDPAKHAMVSVKQAIMPYAQQQKAAIAEPEPLPPNSPKQPRTVASLSTNALALMAMLQEHKPSQKTLSQCKLLATFIASMKQEDGNFHSAKTIPHEQPLNRLHANWNTQATDNALAILALSQAGEKFLQKDWKLLARKTTRHLVKALSSLPDNNLAEASPWVVEALTLGAPQSQDQVKLLLRLSTALLGARTRQPLAPDLAGALTSYPPDTTAAARNTWSVAALAKWFRPFKPDYEEALSAENAVTVAFHLQAQMKTPTSSSLARPKFYLDFFRDRLDGFDFTLRAQTTQIFALAKNAALLKAHHRGVFPDAETAARLLSLTRKLVNVHPAYLNTDIVSNQRGISEEARAVMGEISNRKESKVTPEESGLFNRPKSGNKR